MSRHAHRLHQELSCDPLFEFPPQSMAARLSLFVLTTSTKREKPCVHFSLTVAFAFAVFSNVI